ncbi:toll/interleukin-1 receptor domain-containing protein [Streptomyces sp. NPDC005963]|uniref:toll/interleukin-1 receptor domain-containing protein n=1 Tax=Streptomyces sp. NPDC005963 TaxID=3156721 RepID=UPI003402FCC8
MSDQPFFFTSYAIRQADRHLVAQFHARLQDEAQIKRGRALPHKGFLDTESLRLGVNWRLPLMEALRTTRFVIALISDDYVESTWCGREWAVATERARRATVATGVEPVAVVPLFWTRPTRPLPPAVKALQYRTNRLGSDYAETCLVDLIRGDPRKYHEFVVELMGFLAEAAAVPLPALDLASASALPSAFAPLAPFLPASTASPTAAAAPVAPEPVAPLRDTPQPAPSVTGNGGPRMTAAEKLRFIDVLVHSAVGRTRESWDVYVDSIRGLVLPLEFDLMTDGGSARVRSVALANEALRRPSPDLLVASVDALAELEGAQAAGPLRELVDGVVSRWPQA